MIKKVVGVVLFLVGIFLTIAVLLSVLKMIFIKDSNLDSKSDLYTVSYYVGQILVILVFCFFTFLCYKYGLRWMKGKKNSKQVIEGVESIGEN